MSDKPVTKKNKKSKDMNTNLTNHQDQSSQVPPLSEEDLDAMFDLQAKKAWAQYELLREIAKKKKKTSKQEKTNPDSLALKKVKEYWDDNKDHLIS